MSKRLSDTRELDSMIAALAKIPWEINAKGSELVAKHTQEGAERMRVIIETSDTPFGISQGRSGRVVTGDMLGDVSAHMYEQSNRIVGTFGWTKPQRYYTFQEQGFKHYKSGKDVRPMHALLGAFIATRERFYDDVKKMLRETLP